MNNEQFEALRAATQGHTPGPWIERGFNHVWGKYEDATLAAAAPDLLAEVERLRGWVAHVHKSTPWDITVRDLCKKALSGAEVPK